MSLKRILPTLIFAAGLLVITACDAGNTKVTETSLKKVETQNESGDKTADVKRESLDELKKDYSPKSSDKEETLAETTESKPQPEAMPKPIPKPATPEPKPVEAPQDEDYALVVENPFKLADREPISTFSTDVNTASYSNIRRFIDSGTLPPVDAVRTAEMINYFDYDYPTPQGNDPVAIGLELGPCPWQTDHKLLRIALKARTIEAGEMPPRNLVFLIDVSGSMSSQYKLPLVKRSLEMLIEQLGRQDRVSIVTYANGSEIRLYPTAGDDKATILKVVDSLVAGGGTAGADGLKLAYDLAMTDFNPAAANRVIITTDGDFNIGQNSDSDMVRLIEAKRKSGVYLNVLGYGMGNLKDAKLEQIARHGNGQYAYIDTELEAHKLFVEQGAALIPAAKDVKLQVDFNANRVQAYRLIGYENRMMNAKDFRDDTKDAGDMGNGHAVTALYEVVPVGVGFSTPDIAETKYQKTKPTAAARSGEWLTVRMRYKNSEGGPAEEFAEVLPGDALTVKPSPDSRFAAAVAEFGLLLRNSPYKGNANFDDVTAAAASSVGADRNGHRGEFVRLAKSAASMQQ